MVTAKRMENSKCRQGVGQFESLWLLMGMQKGAAAVESGMAFAENYHVIQHVHLQVYTQENGKQDTKKCSHTDVLSRVVHKS